MQVRLPKAIPPGADVQFKIDFEDQMPLVVARTGYIRDFYMVGQWFPKIGVWWKGVWNCHQFHMETEFFADFGTYDVKLTVPQNEIVGAGGDLVASTNNPDGTKTLLYHSEDVHDFSWAASPSFTVVEDSWSGSAGTVQIHMLMSPGNMRSAPRYLQALKGTMSLFDEWIGPYPYDRITVIDPPHGGWNAGGMEYPTLFTADNSWYMPKGLLVAEDAVEHEFGHQYFQGMVATNEFEEPWLDEGLNSYMEAKAMNALYGRGKSFVNTNLGTMGNDDSRRGFYLSLPDTDPITRLGWHFYNDHAYGAILYGKTTTVLLTLEKIIGEETVQRALHTFFLRYRFTHPTGDDFVKTVEEVSGRDLRWFFDQAFYGTAILDYDILDAHSDLVNSSEPAAGGAKLKKEVYRTYVTVHRKGDFIFPVDVAIKFNDGQSVLEHWDGRDRWVRYQYDRPAALVSAEIDPGDGIWLDRNLFNNSYVVQADTRAQKKLANFWLFFSEWFAQMIAWVT
jgi:aminopeptidase N